MITAPMAIYFYMNRKEKLQPKQLGNFDKEFTGPHTKQGQPTVRTPANTTVGVEQELFLCKNAHQVLARWISQ